MVLAAYRFYRPEWWEQVRGEKFQFSVASPLTWKYHGFRDGIPRSKFVANILQTKHQNNEQKGNRGELEANKRNILGIEDKKSNLNH